MNEEAGRLDVELFADVFTDLDQTLAALAAGARFRFVTVFDAWQVVRQGLATGTGRGTGGSAGFAGTAASCLASSAAAAAQSLARVSWNRSRCSPVRASLLAPKRIRRRWANSRVSAWILAWAANSSVSR